MSSVSHTSLKITATSFKKKKTAKRSIKEDELLALQEAIEIASQLPAKRVRKSTVNKNQAYVEACIAHQSECHRSGGFVSGSGHHYDHEY
jgi:hypothetical protein